jgi:SAM-dependent methyltransferase
MWWLIKQKIISCKERLLQVGHRRRLFKTVAPTDPAYRSYLDMQLARTLLKRQSGLQKRCQDFIDKIADCVDLTSYRVLCVGCRNSAELDYFQYNGVSEVVGIDLYSTDTRIKVMDMHAMDFPDGAFDLVYSSHSLEHSHEPKQVVQEIVRVTAVGGIVAIEVPVEYQVYDADLLDLQSLDHLHDLFAPNLGTILWESYFPKSAGYGTAVIRTIFQLNKKSP